MAEISPPQGRFDKDYKWWIRDSLELAIVIALVLLLVVIYVPKFLWDEEKTVVEESRFRMENVYHALSFYRDLTGKPTHDGLWALKVINAVRDSLIADSLFTGEQKLRIDGQKVTVNILKNFSAEFDTTFGYIKTRKDTLQDSVLMVLSFNEERPPFGQAGVDTNFVRSDQIETYRQDSAFIAIQDTTISSHVEVVSYYEQYRPDSSMFYCPLTKTPYLIEASQEKITVQCPIQKSFSQRRYLVFLFTSKSHGKIENGEKSWARR